MKCMKTVILSLSIFLLACEFTLEDVPPMDGGGNGAEDYVSGERLKARVLTSPDGARQFLGWYDEQLQRDCAFQDLGDGIMRCVPETAIVSEFHFSDPDCRTQVAYTPGTCIRKPILYGLFSYNECGKEVFAITGPVEAVFTRTEAGCTPFESPRWFTYYSIGEKLKYDLFQPARVSIE